MDFSEFFQSYIVEPLSNFTVKDGIDVALLGLSIFFLYLFAVNRRSGRYMLGLIIVSIGLALCAFFNLRAMGALAKTLLSSAVVIIIILFRSEIRSMLERIANANIFNPFSNTISKDHFNIAKNVAEETVKAVSSMSESQTGALIVFEGMTKLGDYISTGKIIDAKVTDPLLRNLFFNKAPLHDGAVIIRNFRVYAVSCVLPSARIATYASYGTRHKAGIGVTEVSDSLVVIVSEETGIISVAQNGTLVRNVTSEDLYDILMTFLAGKAYLKRREK